VSADFYTLSNIEITEYRSAACAGATTTDVAHENDEKKPFGSSIIDRTDVIIGGVNPGAIPSVSFVKGANAPVRQGSRPIMHTQFLDTMVDFSGKHNVDILSLIPVDPGVPFHLCRNGYGNKKYNNLPYIVGGCQMMTAKSVRELGLFRENLPRMEDVEYSQRAIKSGMNIGYHDSYWCYHAGANSPTDPEKVKEGKIQYAMHVFDNEAEKEWSRWNGVIKKINKVCYKNTIVNLVKEK
jgi:GT2 family glycosyltransferase